MEMGWGETRGAVKAIDKLELEHFRVAKAAMRLRDAVARWERTRTTNNEMLMIEALRSFDHAANRVT
jgi:hypothetical protein